MATCKNDCLHHPVCRLPFNKSKTQVTFAQVCHHFKNKADFVEVKHGEWSTDEEDIHWGNSLKKKHCSVCKSRPHFDKEKRKFILTNYCPNCGAKMDGERKKDNG